MLVNNDTREDKYFQRRAITSLFKMLTLIVQITSIILFLNLMTNRRWFQMWGQRGEKDKKLRYLRKRNKITSWQSI